MRRLLGTMALTAALIALAGPPAFAQANDAEGYGDGYQSGAYGRVRSADQGATIIRSDAEGSESDRASVNSPLFPGDTLNTDDQQRVEIQLAGGSMVRIDTGTELRFQSLPNPQAKFQDNTVLALSSGVIRVTSRVQESDEFRVDTPDATVYLNGEGEFRISSGGRGGTHVESLRGVAEVVGNETSVLVRGGMGTTVALGSAPATPRAYSTLASDGFDRWCAARDDAYRAHDRYVDLDKRDDVPAEVRPYYGELSSNGQWDTDAQYGLVWYPTVAADWRPYYDGYWSYGPGGYFWVGNEPWGWAPYHYGCWHWSAAHRWCWIPGPVFAGAWVSWSWGAFSVGWAPLNWWGQPAWWGGPLYAGYYDPHCWTFVHYDHLASHNVSRYAVPVDRVGDDLRHATVVARGPSVDPRRIARSGEWRDRALRDVRGDHAAQMNPIATDRRPSRSMADVQDQLMRRPSARAQTVRTTKGVGPAQGLDPRTIAPRQRRILEDPRVTAAPREVRPQTRDDVRELYERMSRPKETREQHAPDVSRRPNPQRDERIEPRDETPRREQARPQQSPRPQPRAETPQPQRPQPRAETPRPQQARPQPQRPSGHGQERQQGGNGGHGHHGGRE